MLLEGLREESLVGRDSRGVPGGTLNLPTGSEVTPYAANHVC